MGWHTVVYDALYALSAGDGLDACAVDGTKGDSVIIADRYPAFGQRAAGGDQFLAPAAVVILSVNDVLFVESSHAPTLTHTLKDRNFASGRRAVRRGIFEVDLLFPKLCLTLPTLHAYLPQFVYAHKD